MLPVMLGVSLLTFAFLRIIPGDVLDVMYADSPLSIQEIADLRHKLGMDKPFYIQYAEWIGGLARLDAGNSLWTRRPVLQEIADRLPVTIQLAAMAFIVQLVIAIPWESSPPHSRISRPIRYPDSWPRLVQPFLTSG